MNESSDNTSAPRQLLNKATMGVADGRPLNASTGGIEELRKDIQHLMDIEAIKQLKHAYYRCIDTANLEEMRTLIHEDVTVHFKGGTYEWNLQGSDEYVAAISQNFNNKAVTQHNGHHPEIQIISETEATGIWYLHDNFWVLSANYFTTGTALYWDRYLKVDGQWKIKESKYERLYEINQVLEENPSLSSHYLSEHGAEPA